MIETSLYNATATQTAASKMITQFTSEKLNLIMKEDLLLCCVCISLSSVSLINYQLSVYVNVTVFDIGAISVWIYAASSNLIMNLSEPAT